MAGEAASGGIDDFGRVVRTIAAGGSQLLFQSVLDSIAQGSAERREAAANFSEEGGETAIEAAHRLGRGTIVGALLEAGADVAPLGGGGLSTSLAVAIAHDQLSTVKALLRVGHDPAQEIPYAPLDAAPPSPGEGGPTCSLLHLCLVPPLLPCASSGEAVRSAPRLEILEHLVREAGLDVNVRDSLGKTALHWLGHAKSDHQAAIDLLLTLGADVDATIEVLPAGSPRSISSPGTGPPPQPHLLGSPMISLLDCAPYLPEDVVMACVERLIKAHARVRGVFDHLGYSALATAVTFNLPRVVDLLMFFAPFDEKNPLTGRTALHVAALAEEGELESLTLLLRYWFAREPVDGRGRTPIFDCAERGNVEALKLLLKHGASPDVADPDKLTTLMVACAARARGQGGFGLVPQELLRASSLDTRRAVCRFEGFSAADFLLADVNRARLEADEEEKEFFEELLLDLLVARVPLQPRFAADVLPIVVAKGLPRLDRAEAEMAARRLPSRRVFAHEDIVGLALDLRAAREAEAAVGAEERRLRRWGMMLLYGDEVSSSSSSSSDEDMEEEEQDGEKGAAPPTRTGGSRGDGGEEENEEEKDDEEEAAPMTGASGEGEDEEEEGAGADGKSE